MINESMSRMDEYRRAEVITTLNQDFREQPVEDLLQWSSKTFGRNIRLACSFSPEDILLVHLLSKTIPGFSVFYIDTNFLFKESYELIDQVVKKYDVNFQRIVPALSIEDQEKQYGSELYRTDPDLCCKLRKVDPLKAGIQELDAWMTGVRREQAPTRAHAQLVEWDSKNELVKINPLVFWKTEEVWNYIKTHQIPYNRLHDQSYTSIGCQPCTSPVKPGEDIRAGRWRGQGKSECGLH